MLIERRQTMLLGLRNEVIAFGAAARSNSTHSLHKQMLGAVDTENSKRKSERKLTNSQEGQIYSFVYLYY